MQRQQRYMGTGLMPRVRKTPFALQVKSLPMLQWAWLSSAGGDQGPVITAKLWNMSATLIPKIRRRYGVDKPPPPDEVLRAIITAIDVDARKDTDPVDTCERIDAIQSLFILSSAMMTSIHRDRRRIVWSTSTALGDVLDRWKKADFLLPQCF